ncbi:MAG: transaldolase [Propionibacteriaceae bacterium]|nr:transaldolase [Propionibacteriaceae bacterium]
MNKRMRTLARSGVSIWLDDLSRGRLASGNLAGLIHDYSVTGVTTNPTIFAAALSHGDDYAGSIQALRSNGADVPEVIRTLTTTDVRDACDLFADVHASSDGVDGRVSIEVEPGLAMDTAATIAQAAELHRRVDRENVLIKIPATRAGLAAITATIAAGISVNVTLIFSVERYREVIGAYLAGLEQAAAAGRDLAGIHSVASVFVSRVDTEIDRRLEEIGGAARQLKGRAGIANAQLAYAAYQAEFAAERFQVLSARGARPQRPLWASTGVKSDDYPDTLYVSELVAPGVVNTMPEKTLLAYADHGTIGFPVDGAGVSAAKVMRLVTEAGVDLPDVFATLETEGVAKFEKSWQELTATVTAALG